MKELIINKILKILEECNKCQLKFDTWSNKIYVNINNFSTANGTNEIGFDDTKYDFIKNINQLNLEIIFIIDDAQYNQIFDLFIKLQSKLLYIEYKYQSNVIAANIEWVSLREKKINQQPCIVINGSCKNGGVLKLK